MKRLKPTNMTGPAFIREQLGLTQDEVAEWLDISRSLVANYERGERSLPTAALLQLGRLDIIYADMLKKKATPKTNKVPDAASQKRHAVLKEDLSSNAEILRYKAQKMRRDLKKVEEKHEQSLLLIEITDLLAVENSQEKKNNGSLQWFRVKQKKAIQNLKTCDETVQLKMKVKIETMEAMARVCEKNCEL